MAITVTGQVGNTGSFPSGYADGSQPVPRMCRSGELAATLAHGRYQEAVYRGHCFAACNQSVVTFGTALTATGVTFALVNPAGSGVNLVVLKTRVTVVTSSTAGSLVYAVCNVPLQAAVTTASKLTANNCLVGALAAPAGYASASFTLPAAPVAIGALAFGPVTATASTGAIYDEPMGEYILAPNTAIAVQGITIVGTGLISMTWEEIPL